MDGNISEPNDILPFYFRILVFYGRRNACAGFTNDLNLFNGSETLFRIGEEFIQRHIQQVRLHLPDRVQYVPDPQLVTLSGCFIDYDLVFFYVRQNVFGEAITGNNIDFVVQQVFQLPLIAKKFHSYGLGIV